MVGARRQVELGKATLKTRKAEKRTPTDAFLRKRKNASGGVEARFLSCGVCGVEFCTGGACRAFDYDSFKRTAAAPHQAALLQAAGEQAPADSAQRQANRRPTRKKKKKPPPPPPPPDSGKRPSKPDAAAVIAVKTTAARDPGVPPQRNRVGSRPTDGVRKTATGGVVVAGSAAAQRPELSKTKRPVK